MKARLCFAIVCCFTAACGQPYGPSRIFAHNDYARAVPFHTAFDLRVGYIEADVFLVGDKLMVAHHWNEIEPRKTLASLYLEPLLNKVEVNGGSVYGAPTRDLTLMIDLKTEGPATLARLASILKDYPALLACPTLHFMVSGNVPPPSEWDDYPSFITFDGRPEISYTPEQISRLGMISTNFRQHVKWDGERQFSAAELAKITALIDAAHAKGKPMRFWATPDSESSWRKQMELGFDVILTDKVTELAAFMERHNRR